MFPVCFVTHVPGLYILAGYQAEQPVSAEFMQVWRMTQTLADLAVIATAPAMRDVATAHLQQLWV